MTIYTIRPNFTINLDGTIYFGGDDVDLNAVQFEEHKHKLEGVESSLDEIIGQQQSNNSSTSYPAPYFTKATPAKILIDQSQVITLEGSFFTPNITVELEQGTVDAIEFISDNQIKVTVTAGNDVGNYDLILDNGTKTILEDAIELIDPINSIVNLRSGGTDFPYQAIELRSGMSWQRKASGITFAGSNGWSRWARFVGENDAWVRDRFKEIKPSLNLIYQPHTGMIGFGSREINSTSGSQWNQQELTAFHTTATNFYGFYGNSGNPGSTANFSSGATIPNNAILRLEIENFGFPESIFNIYQLPSNSEGWEESGLTEREFIAANSDITDWLGGQLLKTGIIASNMTADASEIMPVVLPNSLNFNILGFYYL